MPFKNRSKKIGLY